jgi:acetylornithine deacetylase
MTDDLDDAVALTMALARIDSVNPSLVADAAGEQEVADFVAAWCRDRGFEVHVFDVAPGRPNVVAVRRGSGGGRSLLFNGHLDTVGVSGPATMEVRHDGDRIVGRGVLDMKAGLAAALIAAASFAPGELAGGVVVAAVVDEEYASIGSDHLVNEWRPDAAVVLEPTDLAVVATHRGFAVIDVAFVGRPAHTSQPERGANAAHAAARAVEAIVAIDARWRAGDEDPARRPLALVSRITSGSETFTVPPRCDLVVEVRTTAADPYGQVAEVVAAIESVADDTTVTCAVALARSPLGTGEQHPFTTAVRGAVAAAIGREPEVVAARYWTDAALHAGAGTPAVVFGPIGQGLHEDLEWVDVASIHACTGALQALARSWCTHP